MTLSEAVNLVCVHLQRHQVSFTLSSARPIDPTHFEVAVREIYPENKMLTFKVEPEEIEDCWKVVEVSQ